MRKEKIGRLEFLVGMWHYIIPPRGLPVNISGETCHLEVFKNQLQRIKDKFTVVSLNELIKMIREKEELPPNALVLSFDDGLKSHYKLVLPLLQELGLTATFFVMTAPLMDKIPPTFKLQLIVGKVDPRIVRKEILPEAMKNNCLEKHLQNIKVPPERFRFESQSVREIKWVCNFLLGPRDKDRVVNKMFRMVWGNKESKLLKKIFMDSSEIIALDKAGMDIESHGIGHYLMSSLEDKDLKRELVDSKKFLELLLDHKISYFAYPSAVSGDNRIWKAVRESGYQAAFEYNPRQKVNCPPYNIFSLRRIHEKDLERKYLN